MARRFRKSYRRRLRRRGFRRRKSVRAKVASINRRLATEVKKNDNVVGITASEMQQLTNVGLHDWAYCYPVLDASMKPGTQLDDIIGEQIKMKYLYLGFHLQQIAVAPQGAAPVTLRIMVVQDRNYREYQNGAPTAQEMFANLFGMSGIAGPYAQYSDVTLLPYNPLQPGRFRIIRDFKMNVSPGWRADYYKKCIILQKHVNSHGKIYFGPATGDQTETLFASPVGGFTTSTGGVFYTVMFFNEQVQGGAAWNPTSGDIPSDAGTNVWGTYGPYGVRVPMNLTAADQQVQRYPYQAPVTAVDPADQDISYSTSRNGIYVLILRQDSPGGSGNVVPSFTLSIQSRFAFYDN